MRHYEGAPPAAPPLALRLAPLDPPPTPAPLHARTTDARAPTRPRARQDFGAYFAVLQGLFYDRFGGRVTVTVGSVMQFAGYASVWSSITRGRAGGGLRVWEVAAGFFLATNGSSWMDMGALQTTLHNSGAERGAAVGVLKSLLGLGAAAFGQVYVTFMHGRAVDFILLLGVSQLCIGAPPPSLALRRESTPPTVALAAPPPHECAVLAGVAHVQKLPRAALEPASSELPL